MGFDYASLAEVATELIADAGRPVTLRRLSSTPADVSKPWGDVQTPAVATDDLTLEGVEAVFVEPTDEDREGPFANVLTRARRVYIAASSLGAQKLDNTWELVDGTVTYKILQANPIKPGPTLLLYILLVTL